MTKPVRIRLSRAKGWRMPENTVKVDRSTRWGNPLVVGRDGTREECVAQYRALLSAWPKDFPVAALRGKNLACWCALGAPCHADVLLEFANAEPPS